MINAALTDLTGGIYLPPVIFEGPFDNDASSAAGQTQFPIAERPVLRRVEVFPVDLGGRRGLVLRDPEEIADEPLIVTMEAARILMQIDGTRTIAEIAEASRLTAGTSTPVSSLGEIRDFIADLDRRLFLDGPRVEARIAQIRRAWDQSSIRPAYHAGSAYPIDAASLRGTLDELVSAGHSGSRDPDGRSLSAIMAPHIDLRVAGNTYGAAFRPLAASDADLIIILGVAHYGRGAFFTTTAKDFETPIGMIETDRDLIDAWQQAAPLPLADEEWSHRTEHSIEFPALFLRHLIDREFTIVPVLCGAAEPHLANGIAPTGDPAIAESLEALSQAVRASGRKAVYLLSVDLAHMGPKFGDPEPIGDDRAAEIRRLDHEMLDTVARFDRDSFTEMMVADGNTRNVDAVSGIFCLMELLGDARGELLAYAQNRQTDTGSVVTFASMAFQQEPAVGNPKPDHST